MSAAQPPDSKTHLRSRIRLALARVSPEQTTRAGRLVQALVRSSSAWRAASDVVLFASLPGEVDTEPLMRAAIEDGKRLLLPRTRPPRELEFARVDDIGGLVRGGFGILEPAPDASVATLGSQALILLPGLAFDRSGGRLGRGAGYYDRALAPLRTSDRRPVCLGVGLALQIVDHVPMKSFDVRLDGFVTEQELWQVV